MKQIASECLESKLKAKYFGTIVNKYFENKEDEIANEKAYEILATKIGRKVFHGLALNAYQ